MSKQPDKESSTLKASSALSRAQRLAGLELTPRAPVDRSERAPETMQFAKEHPFGKLRVQGVSFIKSVTTRRGVVQRVSMTPVACECGSEPYDIRTLYLTGGKTRSCGCEASAWARRLNQASWQAK